MFIMPSGKWRRAVGFDSCRPAGGPRLLIDAAARGRHPASRQRIVGRPLWVDFCPPRRAEIGSSLPVVSTACAEQVKCKRLVSTDAIGLSVAMQMSGQVRAITQRSHERE